MIRGISTCRISSYVNVNNARQTLQETRFLTALTDVVPIELAHGMTLDETFAALARAFPRANRRRISSFSAVPPQHLAESANVTIRAVCARVSRGVALHRAVHDAARHVREAAIARLQEVGEILPDMMPEPIDLSDEYYASIAQRLVNDFPDRNGDWVSDAVAATVRSYRTTSGVQLEAERLLDAVEQRLAELNEEGPCGALDEAIRSLGDVKPEPFVEQQARAPQANVTLGVLPLAVRKHVLEESGRIIVDAPKRARFGSSIGPRERVILNRMVATVVREMRGVTARWTQDGPSSASFQYGVK